MTSAKHVSGEFRINSGTRERDYLIRLQASSHPLTLPPSLPVLSLSRSLPLSFSIALYPSPHLCLSLSLTAPTGSQRISDGEFSDYDCEDGIGVISGESWPRTLPGPGPSHSLWRPLANFCCHFSSRLSSQWAGLPQLHPVSARPGDVIQSQLSLRHGKDEVAFTQPAPHPQVRRRGQPTEVEEAGQG